LVHLDLRDAVTDARIRDAPALLADVAAGERHEPRRVVAFLERVGDHGALVAEEGLREQPAAVHAPDHVAHRHAYVGEERRAPGAAGARASTPRCPPAAGAGRSWRGRSR